MIFRLLIGFYTLVFGLNAFATESEVKCIASVASIDQKLGCLEGVTITNAPTPAVGATFIELQIEQPVDHNNPGLGKFKQRLALIHRGENEPLVLQTSGYNIFGVGDSEISHVYQTNQLQVEHRYFANSRPDVMDWSKLNIEQAAADFHAITVKFKQIYSKNWVNTGASKGGMTSVYHRYFYPDDLAGTVADVAPLSFSRADQRYNDFLAAVGGDEFKKCREDLRTLQVELLTNRDELVPLYIGEFNILGSADVAFEHAVLEYPFYFWQYGNPQNLVSGCNAIPVGKTARAMFQFLVLHAPAEYYFDSSILEFQPYYYQAATQLGSPDNTTAHVETLRKYEMEIGMYAPANVALPYSNEAMRAVNSWVQSQAANILFVYGTLDPWSAAEFNVGNNTNVHKLYVSGGNHGSNFRQLDGADSTKAIQLISTWLGKQPVLTIDATKSAILQNGVQPTLGELEFESRRRLGL